MSTKHNNVNDDDNDDDENNDDEVSMFDDDDEDLLSLEAFEKYVKPVPDDNANTTYSTSQVQHVEDLIEERRRMMLQTPLVPRLSVCIYSLLLLLRSHMLETNARFSSQHRPTNQSSSLSVETVVAQWQQAEDAFQQAKRFYAEVNADLHRCFEALQKQAWEHQKCREELDIEVQKNAVLSDTVTQHVATIRNLQEEFSRKDVNLMDEKNQLARDKQRHVQRIGALEDQCRYYFDQWKRCERGQQQRQKKQQWQKQQWQKQQWQPRHRQHLSGGSAPVAVAGIVVSTDPSGWTPRAFAVQ